MTEYPILLHRMALNYLACVYPFPLELRPEHLDAPDQELVYTGLHLLHQVIHDLYEAFSHVEVASEKAVTDEDYCRKTLEESEFLLWFFGAMGEKIQGAQGTELRIKKSNLSSSVPGKKVKDVTSILPALQAVGFRLSFLDAAGAICPGGWKRCDMVSLGWQKTPAEADALWAALAFFAGKVDIRQPGVPFQAFQRADFRSLLPGGNLSALPYTFEEALGTLDEKTTVLWREMADYVAQHYPKYVPFFRHPDLRQRSWGINYDTRAKGYGLFSLYGDEEGFHVRMVLKKAGRAYVLGHIDELSPRMQEMFLNRITCVDCKHCGQHEFYPHGDHVHKLCAFAWFYSSHLEPEDMPSAKRLIDIHLSHL
jgi:hypothetical protein